jgi:hypothetical protein
MTATRVTRFLLALISVASSSGVAQAQNDSVPSRRLAISGSAEASYSYSDHNVGNAIVGRLYDRFHDQVELNALTLVFDVPFDAARMTGGFHAELLLGQNAAVIKSLGFDIGNQGDVPQLYATMNIPTADGNGVQLKLGRMPTLMGLEVIETVANPNWSEGNQFIYVENFTQTGLSIEHRFSDRLDAQFRVFNGWDVVQDNNTRKSFMARVGIVPGKDASLALLGYYGPEQADNPTADRYGTEALLSTKLGGHTTVWAQGDIGREEANAALPDPASNADWWAVGAWITHDLSPKLALALRGDYLDDQDGARTSGVLGFPANTGHKLWSATGTLNVRSWEGLLLRPELRYDHSDLPAFAGDQNQVSLSLSLAYLF